MHRLPAEAKGIAGLTAAEIMMLVIIAVFPEDVAVPVICAQQPAFARLERAALGCPAGPQEIAVLQQVGVITGTQR
jgi:hypothetical protein